MRIRVFELQGFNSRLMFLRVYQICLSASSCLEYSIKIIKFSDGFMRIFGNRLKNLEFNNPLIRDQKFSVKFFVVKIYAVLVLDFLPSRRLSWNFIPLLALIELGF